MQRHNICVKIVTEINKNNTTGIKAGSALTITTDIWQRNLSLILFNLALDKIIRDVKNIEIGYSMASDKYKYYAMWMMPCYSRKVRMISRSSYTDS